VDTEQALHQQFTVFDQQLFLEHVHLNAQGYLLLADQFYRAIVQSGWLGPEQGDANLELAQQDMPLSTVDMAYARLKIAQLRQAPPFVPVAVPLQPDLSHETFADLLQRRLAGEDWLLLQQQLLKRLLQQQMLPQAARVAAVLSDALPNNSSYLHQAGLIYLNLNDLALADYYLSQAVQLDEAEPRYLLNLAQVKYLRGQQQASLKLLQQAQQLAPQDARIQGFINKVAAPAATK